MELMASPRQPMRRRKASNELVRHGSALPWEIIDAVADLAAFSAHFGFTCSCKRMSARMTGRSDVVANEAKKYVAASCDGARFSAYVLPNGAYHTRAVMSVWKSYIEISFYLGVAVNYRAGPIGTYPPMHPCVGLDWDRLERKFHEVVHDCRSGQLRLRPFDF